MCGNVFVFPVRQRGERGAVRGDVLGSVYDAHCMEDLTQTCHQHHSSLLTLVTTTTTTTSVDMSIHVVPVNKAVVSNMNVNSRVGVILLSVSDGHHTHPLVDHHRGEEGVHTDSVGGVNISLDRGNGSLITSHSVELGLGWCKFTVIPRHKVERLTL